MRALALRLYILAFAVFLLAPIIAITAGSLTTTSYVVFPPHGLTLKWYAQAFQQQQFLSALGLSIGLAVVSATIGTVLGLLVAIALHRCRTPFNRLVYLLVMTPAMLPSVFIGLAFLVTYARLHLNGSVWSLLAGHVVIVTPFTLSLLTVGLVNLDATLERAARSLGASPFRCFMRITLPLIAWSLGAGWGFAFMISFGSLEVSLFLATATLVTLPVQVYTSLEWSPLDPLLTAVSSGLVIITLIVLVVMARFVRIDRFLRSRPS